MTQLADIIKQKQVHMHRIIEKVLKLLEINDKPVELGSGTRGIAYRVGDLVYKVTEDKSEYSLSKRMIGKNTKYINKIHKCYIIQESKSVYYVIVQDYVQPLSEITDDNITFDNLAHRGRSIIQLNGDIEYQLNMFNFINTAFTHQRDRRLAITYIHLIEEMLVNDFKNSDACYDNLGVKDGRLIVFDLGYSDEIIDHDSDDLLIV